MNFRQTVILITGEFIWSYVCRVNMDTLVGLDNLCCSAGYKGRTDRDSLSGRLCSHSPAAILAISHVSDRFEIVS